MMSKTIPDKKLITILFILHQVKLLLFLVEEWKKNYHNYDDYYLVLIRLIWEHQLIHRKSIRIYSANKYFL